MPLSILFPLFLAFLSGLGVALLIVWTQHLHGHVTHDGTRGIQKHHAAPVPRIGGVALLSGLVLGVSAAGLWTGDMGWILLAAAPAFLVGLAEDLFKNMSPAVRLASHFVSAAILVLGGGLILRQTGYWFGDDLLAFTPLAMALTMIILAGITNATNIIDGFHGLSSGSMLIMGLGLALLGLREGDPEFAVFCLLFSFSVAGFLAVNFPFGRLFLGDAGAYLGGFMLGALGLLLCHRHPELTPWTPFMVIFYPIWETLFSILRKGRRAGSSPSQPDRLHIHHLISRSFARPLSRRLNWPDGQNAITGALMWAFPLYCTLFAVFAGTRTLAILAGMAVFILGYEALYRRLSLQWSRRKPQAET